MLHEIHKQHPWRSVNKFLPFAKGFSTAEVKKYFKEHVMHDKYKPEAKDYYLPIFGRTPGCYQFDTLIQSKTATIPAFLIFININSRKAFAYPMRNKGKGEVLRILSQFVSDNEVRVLTSDQDPAYLNDDVINFLLSHDIDYRTTEDNNHNILGIINRFIRTIRDYNKKRDFTLDEMNKVIDDYNNSVHSATGIKPNAFTSKDEEEYIDKMILQTDEITGQKGFSLHKGDKVRVILDKKAIGKNRSNLSSECYIVDSPNGRGYNVVSSDKSVATYPRHKLILTNKGQVAETLNDGKRGLIENIISYDTKTDKYEVVYEGGVKDVIKAKNLRETNPTHLSDIEIQFWKNKPNIPNAIKKFKATELQ